MKGVESHRKGEEASIQKENLSLMKSITGRADTEAEAPILWPPGVKSQLIGKDPDTGKDWGQEETGMTEDEMVGWHYWLNGHKFEQTFGDGEGQGNLMNCSPWGHKELDTERLNNNKTRSSNFGAAHLNNVNFSQFKLCGSLMSQGILCHSLSSPVSECPKTAFSASWEPHPGPPRRSGICAKQNESLLCQTLEKELELEFGSMDLLI